MLRDGYSNLTVVKAFRGKETILLGSTRKQNALPKKRKLLPNVKRHWSASWNGCAWLQKDGKPNKKRVCKTTTSSSAKTRNNWMKSWKSISPTVPDCEPMLLKPRASAKAMATSYSMKTSTSSCHRREL